MPTVPEHLLQKISLAELKKDLKCRELATKGSKADLLCRLSTDELWIAARKGDCKRVKHLVNECGAALDYDAKAISGPNHRWLGLTPLHLAARNGHIDVVKYLIEQGARPDRAGSGEATPLHLAAMNGRLKVVRFLASQNIPIDPVDSSGRTPIYLAVENGKLEVVRYLYAKGASLECRNVQNSRERTLIHLAAMHGFTALVKFIAGRGHNLDCIDANSRSPLHLAAKGGHVDTVKFLAEQHIFLNRTDHKQLTALQLAARAGHADVVGAMIVNNADPEMRTSSNRLTALHLAAMNGKLEVVKLLVGFNVDINCRDTDNKTPLHMSAAKGHTDTVKFLVESGALINCTTRSFNTTPLHLAVSNGHLATVLILHAQGANLNAQANFGRAPLHMACKRGDTAIATFLLENGAKINNTDEAGNTALHEACFEGQVECAQLLLDFHASTEMESSRNGLPGKLFRKNVPESVRVQIHSLLEKKRSTMEQSQDYDAVMLESSIEISRISKPKTHLQDIQFDDEDNDNHENQRLFLMSPKANLLKFPAITTSKSQGILEMTPIITGSTKKKVGRLDRASEPELHGSNSLSNFQEMERNKSEQYTPQTHVVAQKGTGGKLPSYGPLERLPSQKMDSSRESQTSLFDQKSTERLPNCSPLERLPSEDSAGSGGWAPQQDLHMRFF
mmetsp:Transcript_22669/g.29435  ORF Transcript_22669/g.29435 Transcript_22669/m.29435 type:complete len:676 (+) Transcript_22669:75-2102(+)